MLRHLFTAALFLMISAPIFPGEISPSDAGYWMELLGSGIEEAEKAFGKDFLEIEPEAVGSRADRLIWYNAGITLWFSGDEIVQLRADSNAEGSIEGLKAGMSMNAVKRRCGSPWIESHDSLYYNLPWHGGPVRLRFVFSPAGLDEIYLYYVR
ncbi:MAG: hypothetical protein PQJ61_02495 [Spirochaetales bacterium]|uniref:Uncharacterized protein n=1 Tax=Candidatus Thalassospirochaeta sargassi TaxID=3119039 RepID=A0AAJ1IDV8_9SPIO|nr:hypothetical protein [Spirochaetales bacterium]